jgi:hypothetical protein
MRGLNNPLTKHRLWSEEITAETTYIGQYDHHRKEKPMNYKNTRNPKPSGIPKNRSNTSSSAEIYKRINSMVAGANTQHERLNKIEAEMDKRAADIALTISDLFKFVSMSAAILPDMELDTGIMRLKVDDDGVFFGISYPDNRKSRKCPSCCEEPEDDFDDFDDDEEGLLYDGD